MADLLAQSSAWLQDQRHRHLSRPIVYRRGLVSAELQAAIGRTVIETDDGYGVVERFESRDFLIRPGDLVLGDEQTLPVSGDRIEETVGEQTYVYEVAALPGKPACQYVDLFRQMLRVHTKQVAPQE